MGRARRTILDDDRIVAVKQSALGGCKACDPEGVGWHRWANATQQSRNDVGSVTQDMQSLGRGGVKSACTDANFRSGTADDPSSGISPA